MGVGGEMDKIRKRKCQAILLGLYRPGWMESVPQKDLENSFEKNIFFNNIGFDIKGELLFEFHSK